MGSWCAVSDANRTSNPVTHELKCAAEFFDAVESGRKPFEVRVADRPFKVGDILHLREVDLLLHPTGRETSKQVTFILRGWGVEHGHVAIGLRAADETSRCSSSRGHAWSGVHDDGSPSVCCICGIAEPQ